MKFSRLLQYITPHRTTLSLVAQHTLLLNGSMTENIAYGDYAASLALADQVVKM